jgi:hypothetical protein
MNLAKPIALAASALALAVVPAYADTTSSNKDRATMERKASPSAPKQDEERAEAHGIPDNQTRGTTSRRAKAKKTEPSSATGGGNAQSAFSMLDIDGDGAISKAEAAGNADLMKGFDRADRNRDGKLSPREFDALLKRNSKTSSR